MSRRPEEQILESIKNIRPYFNYGDNPPPPSKYVAWVDIMGTKSFMMRSTEMVSIALGKIHTASLRAKEMNHGQISMVPIIDGIYITAEHQNNLLYQVYLVVKALAAEFVLCKDQRSRFVIRGAISYGPVTDGSVMCMNEENRVLINHHEYTNNILLGPAISQANESEKMASPFGIWVHESARHFSPLYYSKEENKHVTSKPLQFTHWPWWTYTNKPDKKSEDLLLARELKKELLSYYEWCEKHSSGILYDVSRIKHHRELFLEYFADVT